MHPLDALKIDIMRTLARASMSIVQLSTHVATLEAKPSQIAKALEELVEDGYLTSHDDSSTMGRVYQHATADSLSDLSAKLLPHRDPVREAHAHEQAQERQPRYRRLPLEGADLGDDD